MVIHANTMNEDDFKRCRSYLENPGQTRWISYGEYLEQKPEVRGVIGRIEEYWLAKVKYLLVRLKG